jgi:hypothetical protein
MKQKKKKKSKKKSYKPSRKTISALLLKLESAHNALQAHHNFNLAEVHIGEYYKTIPQQMIDEKLTKSFLEALRDRNSELLFATIEAEMERLRTEKVKLLRDKIANEN